jgi:hypothetical protein
MTTPCTPSAPSARQRPRALGALVDDDGAATAEYVVATMAAVGLAGLLVVILRGDAVKDILMGLIKTALSVAG